MVSSAKIFDKHWKKYEDWFEEHKSTYCSEVKALKKAKPEGFGLEVGVGSGRFASLLDVKIGIDPSKIMLNLAKKRGIKVIQGVGENLPFKDNIFDFVLIVVTLCFVEEPEYVLKEACRVLKRGGRLVVGEISNLSFRVSRTTKIYMTKKAYSSNRGKIFEGKL